jgi:hypothetical protein
VAVDHCVFVVVLNDAVGFVKNGVGYSLVGGIRQNNQYKFFVLYK